MYVNPFPFGVAVGFVGTLVVEFILLVVAALCSKENKNK